MKFGSYWFETGTPTYLVELLKKSNYNLQRIHAWRNGCRCTEQHWFDVPKSYSGHLSKWISYYQRIRQRVWNLSPGIPNREVEEGFVKYLLPFYTNIDAIESPFQIRKFVAEVRSGDYDAFFRRLQSFFADTPYELVRDLELHYQNVLFIVFKLIGFYVKAEYHTSQGRIDLVLQTDHFIYVMEFKLEGTAEEALQQINDKHYAQAFAADKRQIFKIGINFSNETRNIEKWIVEDLQ